MPSKSTKSAKRLKSADTRPKKPYKDFPLNFHPTGRFSKKVRGKVRYFGRWGNVKDGKVVAVENLDVACSAAVDLWKEQRDDLQAGRDPQPKNTGGLILKDLVNEYLNAKRHLMEDGDLSPLTFAEYHRTCQNLVRVFGAAKVLPDLVADDFRKLRTSLAKTRGPLALGNEIQRAKMLFKWAFDEGKIDMPVRYGQSFNKPPAKSVRRAKAASGPKMFHADELRLILDAIAGKKVAAKRIDEETGKPAKVALPANPRLFAMTLLAANVGFGQSDVSRLPLSALDLDSGWVTFPRPKTGLERRAKLWPETVAAVREAIAIRPQPHKKEFEPLVFLTNRGKPYLRLTGGDDPSKWNNRTDIVRKEFTEVLKELGINGRRGFYGCRHSFRTAADGARDHVAIDRIMDHSDPSMGANYRHTIDDSRLEAVAEHVHHWLFGSEST